MRGVTRFVVIFADATGHIARIPCYGTKAAKEMLAIIGYGYIAK